MTGRLEYNYGVLDELEHATHMAQAAQDQITTLADLDRLRRCVSRLDELGGRIEGRVK